MQKRYLLLFLLPLLSLFSGCDKKLDLDIVEVRCKDLKISNPTYEFVSSQCGNGSNDNAFEIEFNYDGDEECIHLVDPTVRFFDFDGNEVSQVIHSDTNLQASSSLVTVTSSKVKFHYCYSASSSSTINDINYIQVDFHTENEQENESNKLGLRLNIPGKAIKIPTPEETIIVNSLSTTLRVWDHASEDGDIISVYVNGQWVIENKVITNAGETITLPLLFGDNDIVFYAVNQGDSGPNTFSLEFNDGISSTNQTRKWDMTTGETRAIRVRAQ